MKNELSYKAIKAFKALCKEVTVKILEGIR